MTLEGVESKEDFKPTDFPGSELVRFSKEDGSKQAIICYYVPAAGFTPSIPAHLIGQLSNGKRYYVLTDVREGRAIIEL